MKPKALFWCGTPERIGEVFSPEQRRRLARLTDLTPEVVNHANFSAERHGGAEVIFSTWGMEPLREAELAALPALKVLFYAAGATDAFVRPLLRRGIAVVSAWQANAIPVAEFCVAQIVLAMKGYFRNSRELTSPEQWRRGGAFVGPGSYGEKVALIGDGAVACRTRQLLEPYRLAVTMVPSRPAWRTVSLEEVFAESFVVSNHLPDRDDNAGVLDGRLFASMRPGAVFLNTGRGRQVNETELIAVLETRPDLTALLDVTDPEPPAAGSKLYTLPNVRLSSHIAGSVNDEVHRLAELVIEEFERWRMGDTLRFRVEESMLITSSR